jgi:hypothetical protein
MFFNNLEYESAVNVASSNRGARNVGGFAATQIIFP